ncbi:MAG: c-type cytochrome [Acetobacteraceae bacterium]
MPMPLRQIAILLLTLLLSTPDAARAAAANGQGYYTKSQADDGQAVFHQQCAICHGDRLQGGAGPALAGDQFLSVSQYQQITAEYFYDFMSTHMPLTHPGSLTKTQYIDIMAYLLEANGYASGPHQLTARDEELKGIKIEPQK